MRLGSPTPAQDGLPVAHHWVDIDGDGNPEDVSDCSVAGIASLSRILVYSTAGDLAIFGHALFSGNLVAPTSLDEMLNFVPSTPQNTRRWQAMA